ncbi:hypothetical protein ABIB25_000230 [Nakamurella sp. UYEF19]|uniref:hypothetical protein n=1 Tax=Nakamurella sp. UYEF19 TaxID=1756392 RepID=UPI00339586BF
MSPVGQAFRSTSWTTTYRLRVLYGADLVLVRPDQHIAWRGGSIGDPAGLFARVVGAAGDPLNDHAKDTGVGSLV